MSILCKILGHELKVVGSLDISGPSHCIRKGCDYKREGAKWDAGFSAKEVITGINKNRKQAKPDWCPYPVNCIFLRRSQDSICAGRLPKPKPQPHGDFFHTHRLCLAAPDVDVFDLQVNKEDVYTLRRVLDVIDYEALVFDSR